MVRRRAIGVTRRADAVKRLHLQRRGRARSEPSLGIDWHGKLTPFVFLGAAFLSIGDAERRKREVFLQKRMTTQQLNTD
jgi:hypothetical protein